MVPESSRKVLLRKQGRPGVGIPPRAEQRFSDALTNHNTRSPHCPNITPWDGYFLSLETPLSSDFERAVNRLPGFRPETRRVETRLTHLAIVSSKSALIFQL